MNPTTKSSTSDKSKKDSTNGAAAMPEPVFVPELDVKKRDGRVVRFDETLIESAISKAFAADQGIPVEELHDETKQNIALVLNSVLHQALDGVAAGMQLEVEKVQDIVEVELMRQGHFTVARRFIVYREDRKKVRTLSADMSVGTTEPEQAVATEMAVVHADGNRETLDPEKIVEQAARACEGLEVCDPQIISEEVITMLYDGVKTTEIEKALVYGARSRIEKDPAYTKVAVRFLLNVVYREALGVSPKEEGFEEQYRAKFGDYINFGIKVDRLDKNLKKFDLKKLTAALNLNRDHRFEYLGLQTIYDRYLIHQEGRRIETPQFFWMRVAMGLALNEGEAKEDRAIEFYNVLSQFLFVSSTPTLFNSGTNHPQLSSCYLLTVDDDLEDIFKMISDDAKLSKWAGGLGNDWTNVRATGGYIQGTNGRSQGIVPFLKVANDTAVAVNQGGKRKGAMCAYLETWHLDIEDFLELRKNTGDERRRTHDMNTANWIPDLFMKRVVKEGQWTLFDPSEVPDLHDLYGKAFEDRYQEYERMADNGEINLFKRLPATDLWRKMLSMLFETGHPWITFKDPSNVRSPQDHVGTVHSSNLCTEILLNTSADETAVCNLGSINLPAHLKDGDLNEELISSTIATAMRMLDNVIDINYYPTKEAKNSNLKHRPVGLGVMGFQDALYELGVSYASEAAVEFADRSQEMISYYAISASIELAKERGAYETYKGSKWDRGLLPIDTIELLKTERGSHCDIDTSTRLDWDKVRKALKKHGIRNSNTMAIAPTATISNISGVTQSIEPMYKHLFSKSNISGDFTIVNKYLINDLKALDLWNAEMLDDLKYFDGVLDEIETIPDHLKAKYSSAFAIEPKWLIDCASRRQKWIDMGVSLNLYMSEPSGKKLNDMYIQAWEKGLKTTYYLRSLGATQVEKSTQDINRRGMQPRWMKNKSASANVTVDRAEKPAANPGSAAPKACSIMDPDCEACQ